MEKFKFRHLFFFIILLLSATFLFNSCEKDEVEPEPKPEDDPEVAENEAFYGLMLDWYYWYDEIPDINPSLYESPYEVMNAIRKRPEDRWSYVTTRKEFESYYRESKFIGYGFGSKWDGDGKLRVTFIFNTTDLYEEGVRRSWIIEEINGTSLQPGMNINQMLGDNEVGVSNDFLFRKPDGSEKDLTVQKKEVVMNTVLHSDVFEAGSRKAGYLVLQGFTTPTFDELEKAVEYFNSEGIDELILDLRYNGGGQTNVANYLASVIGGQSVEGRPFATYLYNDKLADSMNFTDNFSLDHRENNGQLTVLNLDRLITIATGGTASASELVINGLRPYITVDIIGDDTYGKPMGQNAWYYGDLYAFVPVTFKIANADGFGDYFNGLPADSYVEDDITRKFGDPEESSLKEALNYIETGSFSMLPRKKALYVQPREQMTGLRREIGAH